MVDKNSDSKNGHEIIITRVFDVPLELVWKSWTEPKRVMQWWGPKSFTSPICKIDFRVGGVYLFCMRSPNGKDYWSTGVYRKIIPRERIVCTDSFADEYGNIVPASHYGMNSNWPRELLVIISFEEHENKTKFTLHHIGFPSSLDCESAKQGWNESLDKLAEILVNE